MPRCIRNFWLDAEIDGKRSRFASGPRARDGGFRLDIHYREHGSVSARSLRISGRCVQNKLTLKVEDGGTTVLNKEIER